MNLECYIQTNLPKRYQSLNHFLPYNNESVDITILECLNNEEFKDIPLFILLVIRCLNTTFGGDHYMVKYINHQYVKKTDYWIQSSLQYKWLEDCSEKERNEILTEPKLPEPLKYKFERKFEAKDGFQYPQPKEYIDDKTYFEYPADSYVRTHWRHIEYETIHYLECCNEYYDKLELYKQHKQLMLEPQNKSTNWFDDEILKLIKWVNENVFSDKNLCDTNEKTNMVLIRIATGMINKLSCITKDEKLLLHNMLLEFYTERKRVYMDYHYREVLGLPF